MGSPFYHPAMLTPAGLFRRAVERLRTRDPELDALRRAVRAAIVVPLATAVSFLVVGGSQAPLFTIIGAIWLMVLTDFPGNRQQRALAYCGLGFNGAVLITLGTVVAPIPWLAVALMFVLGVAVTLAGVLSETIAAGQRATLLAYVLPVCIPAGPIGERLLGWAIALAVCVPAALFFLPPRHHGDLRRHAAQVCGALADRLEGVGSASFTCGVDMLRTWPAPGVEVSAQWCGSFSRRIGWPCGVACAARPQASRRSLRWAGAITPLSTTRRSMAASQCW